MAKASDPWGRNTDKLLEEGHIYAFEFSTIQRRFLCTLVNQTRARLVPLTQVERTSTVKEKDLKGRTIKVSDRVHKVTGDPIDVSPIAFMRELTIDDLTPQELDRYIRLEENLITVENDESGEDTDGIRDGSGGGGTEDGSQGGGSDGS